jgi:hypothetical protein
MSKKLGIALIALGVVALLFTMGYGVLSTVGEFAGGDCNSGCQARNTADRAHTTSVTRTTGISGAVLLTIGILAIASGRKSEAVPR